MSTRTAPPGTAVEQPRLILEGITRVYPAGVANDDVVLSVEPCEIRAILGKTAPAARHAGYSAARMITQLFIQGSGLQIDFPSRFLSSPAYRATVTVLVAISRKVNMSQLVSPLSLARPARPIT